MGSARGPRAGLGGPPKPACPSSNFLLRTKMLVVRSFRRAAENCTPAACAPRAAARLAISTSDFGFSCSLISTRLQPGVATATRVQPLQRFSGRRKPLKRLECFREPGHPAKPKPCSWRTAAVSAAQGVGKSEGANCPRAFGSPFSEHFVPWKMRAFAPFGRCEPPRRRRSYCMDPAKAGC